MIQTISIGLVIIGLMMLSAAARPAYRVWKDSQDQGWLWLVMLISAFIIGYTLFLSVLLFAPPSPVNLGLATILCAGGLFVIIVVRFSARAIVEANRQTEREYHDARHDSLTGLPNRQCFMENLDSAIAAGNASGQQPFAVLMLDLDHFKEINDTLGHAVGDKLLKQLGHRLKHLSDADNVISRLGGDEFALLLTNSGEPEAIEQTLHLFQAIDEQFMVDDHALMVDMSAGISLYPRDGTDQESLLKRADIAMYIAKKNKQKYMVYDENEDSLSVQRLGLLSRVKNALLAGQMELYYQPIFYADNQRLKGFEALIRWPQEDGSQIPPGEFIPQIEQSRFIGTVSRWVIKTAIEQLISWQHYRLPFTMSINLSAIDIQDRELVVYLRQLIADTGVKAEQLCFEITENAILADTERARQNIVKIIGLGAKIAMDDFGTGFSSLSVLREFPAQFIKIDQTFVKEMNRNREDSLIVNSVVELTHSLGRRVIAEGVEDEETVATLTTIGCDFLQGYHLQKPMSYNQTTQWLKTYSQQIKAG